MAVWMSKSEARLLRCKQDSGKTAVSGWISFATDSIQLGYAICTLRVGVHFARFQGDWLTEDSRLSRNLATLGKPYPLAGRGCILAPLGSVHSFSASSARPTVIRLTCRNPSDRSRHKVNLDPRILVDSRLFLSQSTKRQRSDIVGPWDEDFIGSEIVRLKKREKAISKAFKTCIRLLKRKRPLGPASVEELVFTFNRLMKLLHAQAGATKPLEERLDVILDQHIWKEMSSGGMALHATTTLPLDSEMRKLEMDIPIARLSRNNKRRQMQKRALYRLFYEWAEAKQLQPNGKVPAATFEGIKEMLGGPDCDQHEYKGEVAE